MIKTFEVANIQCGGCASTIRKGLEINGFISVRVDLIGDPRKVTAEIENDERLELFKTVMRDHGYPLLDEKVKLAD